MFSVPCPRHFPAYCFPQINFPVSLNVQLIVRHLCWLYCVVRDGIVRDGMLRGWGFHIFKIAGNFNFSFNYEIPVGDFILLSEFLLFFFFFFFRSKRKIFNFLFLLLHDTYSIMDTNVRYVTKICIFIGNFILEFLICCA